MTSEQISGLYTQINAYILQNFELFWAIMLGILAVIGVALYFIAKSMVQKGIENSVSDVESKISTLDKRVSQFELMQSSLVPVEYDLPLEQNYVAIDGCKCCYSKSDSNLLVLTIAIAFKSGQLPAGMVCFATLPAGYRPAKSIGCTINGDLRITVEKDGRVGYISRNPLDELTYASITFYTA